MKILVLGVGSILRSDDAIGIRVVEELEKKGTSENVTFKCGDISGLDLIKYFPGHDRIILIDAADMKLGSGTIKVFDPLEIRKSDFTDNFSTHGMALLETLTIAEKLDVAGNIKIVGVQPYNTDFGLEMTDGMKRKMPDVIENVKLLIKG